MPLAQECVDRAEETGASACIMVSSWILGDALHQLGRYAEARDVLKRGADVALAVDRQVWRPTLQSWLRKAASATPALAVKFLTVPNLLNAAAARSTYRLHLTGGMQLEVGSGFRPEELATLLRVMREL
jgi:hypothetical protein